jgi:hypothetical protein
MRTCGKAGIAQPADRLNLHVVPMSPLPRSVRDALADPHWHDAMQAEFDTLLTNDTPGVLCHDLLVLIWLQESGFSVTSCT